MTAGSRPFTWPVATRIGVTGLLVAALGIVIQFLALPELFPAVPPGPIVLVVVAGLVVLGARWWWSPLLGAAVAVMIAVGGLLSGNLDDNLSAVGPAIGAVVMILGLAAAIGAGGVAMSRHRDTR